MLSTLLMKKAQIYQQKYLQINEILLNSQIVFYLYIECFVNIYAGIPLNALCCENR